DSAQGLAWFSTGYVRVSIRQVAPRLGSLTRFCGCSRVANSLATGNKASSDSASGSLRSVFLASLLRPPFVLFCGSYDHGQCVDAERVATNRAVDCDTCGDAVNGQDIFQERG